jgi:hypothetical protein
MQERFLCGVGFRDTAQADVAASVVGCTIPALGNGESRASARMGEHGRALSTPLSDGLGTSVGRRGSRCFSVTHRAPGFFPARSFGRRVVVHDFTFEAGCSPPRIACKVAHLQYLGFIARLRPNRFSRSDALKLSRRTKTTERAFPPPVICSVGAR